MGPGIRVDSGAKADREAAAAGGEEAVATAEETAGESATV
jgi:hypothetical protein